jgi:hypothetical protein
MKITSKFLALLVAAFALFGLTATPAAAQATRTWVSGVGDDVNPCSRTAPCKTFAGAISKTAPGGEINCLDPAGFGAVTITKSITIDCTGTLGGALASSTTGVIVNGAGAIVTLRGLSLNGGPPNLPGVNGVRFLQGARVNIEDSVIFNFLGASPNGFGIIINNTSTTVRLNVINTVIRNNGGAGSGGGIRISPTGTGGAIVTLTGVSITSNSNTGVDVNTTGNAGSAGITVTMADTLINGSNNGILVNQPAGTTNVTMMLRGVTVSDNVNFGIIAAGAGITMRVGSSVITGNGLGVQATSGAQVLSYGNNQFDGNPAIGAPNNGAFTGLPIPPK